MKEHWERVYQKSSVDKLGWYEARSEPSLKLIERCKLGKNAAILNAGAGATTLVDELIEIEYQNIIANDISKAALEELQLRLGQEKSKQVSWIVDDLTDPAELQSLEQIDLWHDRAVLHFFNDEPSQDAYFNLNGAPKCSGLPVSSYDAHMLQEKLGEEFHLMEAFDYTYTMPSGDTREYVYTLFQREKP